MESNTIQDQQFYKPIPGNEPIPVLDSTVEPYKYVGLLRMTFEHGKKTYGTGTLIAKTTGDEESIYVLTCAHNVYNSGRGGKAKKVQFVRAFNDPNEPFPPIEAVDWKVPDGYPAVAISESVDITEFGGDLLLKNINLDYALVKLKTSVNPGGKLPVIAVKSTEELSDLNVQINGYGYFKKHMSHATGKITDVGDVYLRYPISTSKGGSGSSIVMENGKDIVGIHTRSTKGDFNQGVRITEEVKNEILGWM